jgi:hypothetical protein
MDDKTGNLLFNIGRRSFFLQNMIIKLVSYVHPSIEHNIGKIEIIKRAMFHCELEAIQGSYFEFGVYEGSSLYSASINYRNMRSKIKRNFYGFDSFEGFKYHGSEDKHPFFKEGDFSTSLEKVKKRFKKFPNVTLIKGYFEDSVHTKKAKEIQKKEKCAILFIDCDLSSPAMVSFNYAKPMLQKGSVIILDDYWAYKGSASHGTFGALQKFLKQNPSIKVRPYYNYGHGGTSFVVYEI